MLEVASPGTIGGIGAESCKTDGSGNISVFRKYVGWRKTWHSIIPGNFGGTNNTDRLFYDQTTGDGEFFTINSSGNVSLLKKHTGWRKTWKLIIPGNFGGNNNTDLLFYDPTTGEGEFYTTDGKGNISLLKKHTGWRKTWHSIIPGNFGGTNNTDLLFYDPTTGEGYFFTTDGNGNISLLKGYSGWRKTWKLIVPENSSSYTALLFYDPTPRQDVLEATNDNTAIGDEDKIKKLFEETYASNVRAGDVDAYVAMFTEDAFWMPPGDVDRRGVNEIAEAFGMQSISVDIEPKLTAEEIKVIGDFAYLVGISLATISPKDGGQTNKVKLRIVWLLRKEAGIWKIAREIWNSKPL